MKYFNPIFFVRYVNIGDNEDSDDKKSETDLDLNAREPSPKLTREKSPEPMKHDLSDDEYDDDAIVQKLGANSRSGESSKTKSFNGASSSNALKDNLGLADSLMSSLMESSMPTSADIGWRSQAFYQQQASDFYPDVAIPPLMGMYEEAPYQMNNIQTQMMMPHSSGHWPQNSASSFFQEMKMPGGESFNRNSRKPPMPLRLEAPHHFNRQLTGKGRQRRF